MKAVLEPLASLPGVHLAMLVSQDGVPIVLRGEARTASSKERVEDAEMLAALAAGWIADLVRAVGPISWGEPRHLVLRASRGTLVAMQVPRALLVVLLGGGVREADLRLPMESAVARLGRGVKSAVERHTPAVPPHAPAAEASVEVCMDGLEPPGVFPMRGRASPNRTAPDSAAGEIDSTRWNGAAEPHGPIGPFVE